MKADPLPLAVRPPVEPGPAVPRSKREAVAAAVDPGRLLDTAVRLIREPSPTGEAGRAADALAAVLREDGFAVERVAAGHAAAPAVVVRLDSGRPGRTLQFDGHLDTVHLPFVPPAVRDGRLTGSGSADMKAGIAAAVEALRALRDCNALTAGAVLLTAHDLHESPWGDGSQLEGLIAAGHAGDGVLIPEYLNDVLPVVGRGGLIRSATVRRSGPPVHEAFRPVEPDVIAAAADLIARLGKLGAKVGATSDPVAGAESVFVGRVQAGRIYNEFPAEAVLEGTRRWLPGTQRAAVEQELREVFAEAAAATGTAIDVQFRLMRDAFRLDPADPLVRSFQAAYASQAGGPLQTGGKPFVDDGNTFWENSIPAVTHGPAAGGAHTLDEWVSIDDLVRLARVYALTALDFCTGRPETLA